MNKNDYDTELLKFEQSFNKDLQTCRSQWFGIETDDKIKLRNLLHDKFQNIIDHDIIRDKMNEQGLREELIKENKNLLEERQNIYKKINKLDKKLKNEWDCPIQPSLLVEPLVMKEEQIDEKLPIIYNSRINLADTIIKAKKERKISELRKKYFQKSKKNQENTGKVIIPRNW